MNNNFQNIKGRRIKTILHSSKQGINNHVQLIEYQHKIKNNESEIYDEIKTTKTPHNKSNMLRTTSRIFKSFTHIVINDTQIINKKQMTNLLTNEQVNLLIGNKHV